MIMEETLKYMIYKYLYTLTNQNFPKRVYTFIVKKHLQLYDQRYM